MKVQICLLACAVAVAFARPQGHGRPRGPPPPEWMKDLSKEVKMQFHDIMTEEGLTMEEKKAKAEELAQSVLTPEQLVKFEEFVAKMEAKHAEITAKIEEEMAKLSETARAAAEEIKAAMSDAELTWVEKQAEKEEIIATLSEEDKQQLKDMWMVIKPLVMRGRHGPGGPRGHGKPRGGPQEPEPTETMA